MTFAEMASAAARGISAKGTCYTFYNSGKPVVILLHGLGLTQEMWRYQLEALCRSYSPLVYDLTGMGGSSPPKGTPDLTMFSRQLADLMGELDIEKAVIAGFSLGGMIVRRFAMDFPERAAALVIMHTAYKRDAAGRDAVQARVNQAKDEGPKATVEDALSRWFTSGFREGNPDVMDWVRAAIVANDRDIYPKIYQVLVDGADELAAPEPPITMPALIMTAEHDYGNSKEMAYRIAAEICGSETVILPGLKHMAMVEAPELFNRHLLDFLDSLEGEALNG